MKKVILAGASVSSAISLALIGAAPASAAPDVTGEQYNKAQAILKSQGFSAVFGGSVGDVLPQSKCLVSDQTVTSGGKVRLRLDCTQAAANQITPPSGAPGAPSAPGAPDGPAAVVPGAAPVPGGFPQVGVPVRVG